MRRVLFPAIVCGALMAAPAAWSKGPTIQITIEGDGLSAPIVITDPEILDQFNIWNGPGVSMTGPDGEMTDTAHLDPDQAEGRFIDWPKGAVPERPPGLQRLQVTFFIGVPTRPEDSRLYQIGYEIDGSHGFIFLPMWTNSLIHHGVEGNWFHSTHRWNDVIGSLVAEETVELPPVANRAHLDCTVGRGSLSEDGTVEFRMIDKDGNKTSRWRYEATTPGYDRVRAHIGDVAPGEVIEISCWPPRNA